MKTITNSLLTEVARAAAKSETTVPTASRPTGRSLHRERHQSVKIIVVKKRSTWDQYHSNPGSFGKIGNGSLKKLRDAHIRHLRSVESVLSTFLDLGVRPWIVDGAETAFDVGPGSIVTTIGGDGTLLSASHHVGKHAWLIGVNSDPELSQGKLCGCDSVSFPKLIRDILRSPETVCDGRLAEVTRMEVLIGKKSINRRVLNEALFSHACPAAMTRFALDVDGKENFYSCSGVWLGTGAGSTGAISSAGGMIIDRGNKKLQAVVREPYSSRKGPSNLFGHQFILTSKTGDATLYLDGPFIRVPVGFDQKITFRPSPEPLSLVGLWQNNEKP